MTAIFILEWLFKQAIWVKDITTLILLATDPKTTDLKHDHRVCCFSWMSLTLRYFNFWALTAKHPDLKDLMVPGREVREALTHQPSSGMLIQSQSYQRLSHQHISSLSFATWCSIYSTRRTMPFGKDQRQQQFQTKEISSKMQDPIVEVFVRIPEARWTKWSDVKWGSRAGIWELERERTRGLSSNCRGHYLWGSSTHLTTWMWSNRYIPLPRRKVERASKRMSLVTPSESFAEGCEAPRFVFLPFPSSFPAEPANEDVSRCVYLLFGVRFLRG